MGKLAIKQGNIKMLRAEFLKMQRTWILWLHIAAPLAGILIFLLYYRISGWNDWGKISGYIQVVAIVCPTLVGFVCALSAEQEKQAGHFQNILGVGRYQEKNLAVKLASLMLWNLAAVLLAVGGFGAGYYLAVSKMQVPVAFYFVLTGILWVCQLFSYCFHLFLGLKFTKGITIGAGIVESLLAALMLTGMGEGLWQYIPSAWAVRLTGYYIQNAAEVMVNSELVSAQIKLGCVMLAAFTFTAVLLVFVWFHFYEGNQIED